MSIVVLGGPRRGKSSIARLLAETNQLQHLCTDPQRFCRNMAGTPDSLEYDQVSQWVSDNWMQKANVVIEGVHAARALQKWIGSPGTDGTGSPVKRVVYMIHEMEQRMRPGQRAQATTVARVLTELMPSISGMLELWEPDGRGGFQEVPRCQLVSHTPSAPVQYKKKVRARA